MTRFAIAALAVVVLTQLAGSAETLAPANQRFADSSTEAPDFQRHVLPLLGRLGCNGRACHGSFQGQGGFRLSLFGYDFDNDHQSLTKAIGDEGQRRVNAQQPADSLVLRKPTLETDHEGGRRFGADSWQYRLLSRWIEDGAQPSAAQQRLVRLQVEPNEVVFDEPGRSRALRVIAHWDSGGSEDVTCLCRFESGDDSIAAVDADGQIKAMSRGDTHVVAFYDNGVTAVPVMIPVTERFGDNYSAVAAKTKVDELVIAKLSKLGIVPSDLCSDAEFLRRVSIDMTGTLPTPAEIEEFLADESSDKRTRKIDELLESPAYAAWWANRLCDVTGNNPFRQGEQRIGYESSVQWYSWIYRRIAENAPYDELVAGIVLATGRRKGQSYDQYAQEMSSYLRDDGASEFADRPTMPHYWTRRNIQKPEEKALALAHSFLGIRLQCAECHKHPYDQWTQDDFKQFSRFFAGVTYGIADDSQTQFERVAQVTGQPLKGNQENFLTQEAAAIAAEGRTIAWRELFHDPDRGLSGQQLSLLGDRVSIATAEDPRDSLMQWMRRRDNPYFARAFVNRVWANYFHAGLVEPVDDLNLANPPSNAALLDYLAGRFVANGYDMKWLHREITQSDTYQRSWRPNETNAADRRNFSRAIPRRLQAEVIYDALKQATAPDSELAAVRDDLERRAIGHLATRMAGTYAQLVFGQPERLIACDCERNNTPSLLQSIFLQNDPLIHVRLRESGWLAVIESDEQLASQAGSDEATVAGPASLRKSLNIEPLIRQAYLRTVSRPPTNDEVDRARSYLAESESAVEGVRDLLWALLNSKEFVLNH